jgi:hypothetical protein
MYTCADKETAPTAKVKVGSVIFLYNTEAGTLVGPFTALSEGAETVDAGAWKADIDDHSASQNVKLEWEELHTLVNAAEKLPFLKEPKTCALTTTQTQRALDLLKQAPLYLQVRK